MVHITDVCHTCIITLVLPSKFTLEKMKETCMVQSNVISTGSYFSSEDFLTVHIHPAIWETDRQYSFSNVGV